MIQPFLQPQEPPGREILTVSQLNKQAKRLLENQLKSIWLSGEISNLTRAISGHWYFTLKDQGAQIRCAMFKSKVQRLNFSPTEGDKVIVRGNVSLYEARGDYQLIGDFMEPAGLGDLQQRLNALIKELEAKGVFDAVHKKPLPHLPKQIGIITSATGAAVHDVLTVLKRRCPMIPVVIYPTQVQGAAASASIIKAINIAENRGECDVLLLTRGGGSLEDLWCFNDKRLAKRIFDCKIPLVAAIGHEVDTTVAELIADLRAATPSAAAELLVPEQDQLRQQVDGLSSYLNDTLNNLIQSYQNRLDIARLTLADPASTINASHYRLAQLEHRLLLATNKNLQQKQHGLNQTAQHLPALSPQIKLKNQQQKVSQLEYRLSSAWQQQFETANRRMQVAAGSLDTLSPLSTLSRGYSIARKKQDKGVINKVEQLKVQESFSLLLSDGSAECLVEKLMPNRS